MRDPESGAERPTELEGLLRERAIERVVVCGLATDYCVLSTALDAVRLGFGVTLLGDAVAAVNTAPDDGDRALLEMAEAGVTSRLRRGARHDHWPNARDRAISTTPASTATAPMTTHTRSAVMKLRGANGRFRPWAIQTSPPRTTRAPSAARMIRIRRSYR